MQFLNLFAPIYRQYDLIANTLAPFVRFFSLKKTRN